MTTLQANEIHAGADRSFLRLDEFASPQCAIGGELTIVDLFSGCGGLSIGAIEGARRVGRQADLVLAIDHAPWPLRVLRETLKLQPNRATEADLGAVLARFPDKRTTVERRLFRDARGASLLVAGPPCQGHSALNNHTRHDDPRNDLYVAVARAARLIEPGAVVIENVSGIGSDRRASVERCSAALEELGYEIVTRRIDLSELGVPQRRVRHLLVATRERQFAWPEQKPEIRDVRWAIEDLLDRDSRTSFDTPSRPSPENQARMDWLLAQAQYNLPNHLRPVCHQSDHSYVSMYGRLRWDAPAQTITSGFGSMGQGRFVHPLRPRTLTPHEAARLQFLPDFVRFESVTSRTQLANIIGNVAPPALTIRVVSALVEQKFI